MTPVRQIIRRHLTATAVLLFLIVFALVHWIKPAFFYNRDGSVRLFGIGYKNKTILPLWLFSIVLGILSYLAVLWYLTYPKLI